jgi:hypothetical protein
MPMVSNNIADMDRDRIAYSEKLSKYIAVLEEETRVNRLILESILASCSEQSENSRRLSEMLAKSRSEQRPSIRQVEPLPQAARLPGQN